MPPSPVKAEKTTAVPSMSAQPSAAAPILAQNTAEAKMPTSALRRKVGVALARKIVRVETGIANSSPRELPSRDSADADGQDIPINRIKRPAAI